VSERQTTLRLGDVVKITRGISYKSSEIVSQGGLPFVNLRNVAKGGGLRTDGTKRFSGQARQDQLLVEGDLLIAITDLSKAKDVLGSAFLVPNELAGATFSLDLCKLEVTSSELDRKFLYHYLWSPTVRQFMRSNGQGITVMHLRMRELPNLEIPIPPLEQQLEVVGRIESALAIVDKALDQFEGFRFKITQLEIGWMNARLASALESDYVPRLGDIAETKLGKMLDSAKNVGAATSYLRNANVQWGTFDLESISEAPMTDDDRADLCLQSGDVLVCEGGVPGRAAVWDSRFAEGESIAFQKALHRVRVGTSLIPEFLVLFLRYAHSLGLLDRFITGTTIKHLPQAQLRKLPIPALSVGAQREFISEFNALKERLASAENALEATFRIALDFRRKVLSEEFKSDEYGEPQ
jgi:type I restriction enzyme S subunit